MLGALVFKGWSKTQSLIAFSSGESMLYATLRAAAEALGIMSMMKDLGYNVKGEIWSDASAALGIIHRTGLGKTRHIDTSLLWIQQTAAEQRLRFQKVLGKHNPADLFIKYLDQHTSEGHTETMKYIFEDGRAKEAPKLHVVRRSVGEYLMNVSQIEWPLFHVILGKGSTWSGDDGNWRFRKQSRGMLSGQMRNGNLGMVGIARKCARREAKVEDTYMPTDGFRTAGAPGNQLIGTGVQRLERQPAYQPWGSTLTFQHKVGVSWVHGLRHGVARHPRGRHLREGMILLYTWESHTKAREQQPPQQQPLLTQPHDYGKAGRSCRSAKAERVIRRGKGNLGMGSWMCCLEREIVRREGARATRTLCAGPSRPASGDKGKSEWEKVKGVTTRCWAVSPHLSKARKGSNGNYTRRKVIVRCQPEEFSCAYRLGMPRSGMGDSRSGLGRRDSWPDPFGTRSNLVSQYCEWSTPCR